jgi:BioD-like phosphotransacetylase family protein
VNNLIEQVELLVNTTEKDVIDSSFYKNYRSFASDYQILIEKGIATKRESQMASILDKNTMTILNYNY